MQNQKLHKPEGRRHASSFHLWRSTLLWSTVGTSPWPRGFLWSRIKLPWVRMLCISNLSGSTKIIKFYLVCIYHTMTSTTFYVDAQLNAKDVLMWMIYGSNSSREMPASLSAKHSIFSCIQCLDRPFYLSVFKVMAVITRDRVCFTIEDLPGHKFINADDTDSGRPTRRTSSCLRYGHSYALPQGYQDSWIHLRNFITGLYKYWSVWLIKFTVLKQLTI